MYDFYFPWEPMNFNHHSENLYCIFISQVRIWIDRIYRIERQNEMELLLLFINSPGLCSRVEKQALLIIWLCVGSGACVVMGLLFLCEQQTREMNFWPVPEAGALRPLQNHRAHRLQPSLQTAQLSHTTLTIIHFHCTHTHATIYSQYIKLQTATYEPIS